MISLSRNLLSFIAIVLYITKSDAYVPTPLTTRSIKTTLQPSPLVASSKFIHPSLTQDGILKQSHHPSGSFHSIHMSTAADDEGEEEETTNEIAETKSNSEKTSFLSKINPFKKKNDDGLTTKQRLAKMGMSVLLSYGWVSNMSYALMNALAWYGFSKKTGQSPLAPGQWKGFLAVYAGFYVFNNVIRPLRLALSVGVSRYFDDAVSAIQKKTNLSKSLSIGVVVFLANIVGTLSAMALGVVLASKFSGVPIFPPKVAPGI